jgi:hypothetical protein
LSEEEEGSASFEEEDEAEAEFGFVFVFVLMTQQKPMSKWPQNPDPSLSRISRPFPTSLAYEE